MDQTRKQSRVVFSDAPARLVGVEGEALAGSRRRCRWAAAALAAEQVGGRPTGPPQLRGVREEPRAVRPPDWIVPGDQAQVCGHALGRGVGQVRGVLRRLGLQERNDELPIAASLAKSFCSEAYFHCAAENIQSTAASVSRGEHHAHLYFKRAKSSELFLGDPAYHRELLAQRLGTSSVLAHEQLQSGTRSWTFESRRRARGRSRVTR